ncbi:MAG: hypothetical protein A2Z18_01705 [Armatimonadetes bacterium RBG_16_58_9]|nr:MAG: hypothetical protein A2Z18_01705 [Armatimonadetes bacterium RBG_16_58_9]
MTRRKLDELWQAKRATAPKSLAKVILSEPVKIAVRKELKRMTGYKVELEEIGRLLEETCLREECFGK